MKIKTKILILLIQSILVLNISCSEKREFEPNFELAKKFTTGNLSSLYQSNTVIPFWINKTDNFLYAKKNDNIYSVYFVNPEIQQKELLLSVPENKDETFIFVYDGEEYQINPASREIRKFQKEGKSGYKNFSPDSANYVFVQHDELFVVNVANGKKKQISHDAGKYYSFKGDIDYNFTNVNIDNDTAFHPPNLTWSPNSKYFLAFRTDARHLSDMWVINSLASPRPQLITYKQRNPGEKRRINELWIYDVQKQEFKYVSLKKWEDENYWFLGWSKYESIAFLQRINWQQSQSEIIALDIKTGSHDLLFEENPNANIFPGTFQELGKNEFLWWSRKDGYGHFYKVTNKEWEQLTNGKFNTRDLMAIDSISNRIYFTANSFNLDENPYYEKLLYLDCKTGKSKNLTIENAQHQIYLSPHNNYFVDNFSRVDFPHKSALKDTEGKIIMELENADTIGLFNTQWKAPEIFTVNAADDSTQLWGVMWKPFDFNPNKKYPIISYVYPGPQNNFVPLSFHTQLLNTHLAQYGFIVVMCETRGSSYFRDLNFSEFYRTNLRDYPLADNKYMLEQLAQKYNYIDLDKVGIWGGSSGGFMAASAMFRYPDFYKVGVTRAGQHDPYHFHGWWSDIFDDEPEIAQLNHEKIPTNIEIAKNLKGKLLIIHGESDMNVHPSNSALLVNELMKQGKYFDYLVVPDGGHGWSENGQYVQKRIWLYFVENLMNYNIDNIDIND